jgi:hypothetical protein
MIIIMDLNASDKQVQCIINFLTEKELYPLLNLPEKIIGVRKKTNDKKIISQLDRMPGVLKIKTIITPVRVSKFFYFRGNNELGENVVCLNECAYN